MTQELDTISPVAGDDEAVLTERGARTLAESGAQDPLEDAPAPDIDGNVLTASKPKSLISNGLWSVASTVWSMGVTFFLTPFLIARIGTDHYGLFILLMSISGMMGIMNLGLGEATLRYVAYYYGRNDLDGINRVVGATFAVYVVMGLLGWTCLFFGASWIAGLLALSTADEALAASLLRLTAFSFGLSFISGSYASIPQAMQRFDISTNVSVAQSIFQVAGTVWLLAAGYGVYQLVQWSVATCVFTQIVNTVVAKHLIAGLHLTPRPTRQGLREIFGYGIFAMVTGVFGMIWGHADRVIVGTFVGPASVGYLTVPQQLSLRGSGCVAGAGAGLFPRFSGLRSVKEREDLFLDSTWVMLSGTVILFVPFTVLFPDLLRLWLGKTFAAQSAWVGQVIACSCIVRGAFVPYDALFRGIGRPQYMTVLFTCTGLTSLTANLILIPQFGLGGAGYCYAITVFWGMGAIVFAGKKVLRMPNLRPFVRVLVLPMAAGAGALLCSVVARTLFPTLGWFGLSAMWLSMSGLTALLIGAAEQCAGGSDSRAARIIHRSWSAVRNGRAKVMRRITGRKVA